MFQNIIYTIYNQSSDNKFVSEIADKCGSENDGKENQSRKFFRNRWNDIVDAENDGPDDPNRMAKGPMIISPCIKDRRKSRR